MLVTQSRVGPPDVLIVNELLRRLDINVEPVDEHIAQLPIDGLRRHGKGRHRARLNFGDCFSCALALARAESLLFVGDDFTDADITPSTLNSDRVPQQYRCGAASSLHEFSPIRTQLRAAKVRRPMAINPLIGPTKIRLGFPTCTEDRQRTVEFEDPPRQPSPPTTPWSYHTTTPT
jgi:hypothetical protein